MVDNSSAFRLADDIPLVVPEANAHAARERGGNLIANPNCTTAAAVVALAAIRDVAGLASVDLASYQAVSGAGRAGVDAFDAERGTRHRDAAAGLAVPWPNRRFGRSADRRPRRRGMVR